MQGRSEFTQAELDELRRLARLKAGASVSKQKQLRAEMRRLGFFASDFGYTGHGFREPDLDQLINKGQVRLSQGETGRLGWFGRLRRALSRWWA